MKIFLLLVLTCLPACSWIHSRSKAPTAPTELIVTGAPAGSTVFIDGVQNGQSAQANDRTQVLSVAAGTHSVEVRTGSTVVYREQTYVGSGERRLVKVLSGSSRE